jgi:hypothetical protein
VDMIDEGAQGTAHGLLAVIESLQQAFVSYLSGGSPLDSAPKPAVHLG